jgi:glycosyltransferase involved in cell wall biosynthesis
MPSSKTQRDALLLVANYDSDVGYAWWLMESFWVALADRYAPGADVVLAYPSISKVPAAIASAPMELAVCDYSKRSFGELLAQWRLIVSRRARVMYLTDAPSLSWRYALYRLGGVRRIIVHDHTPGRRTPPGRLALAVKKLLHRLPLLPADAMIGVTPYVSRRHREVVGFPADRCFVAENGIPEATSTERLGVHTAFGIPASRRVLVAVGRANHVKGITVVLEAMAKLVHQQGRRDVHFLFCGDGPHLGDFKVRATALGITEFVTFAGRQHDIMPILRGCDMAIHASSAEVGYSLSILECMQARLPLVVSDDESVAGASEHGLTALVFRTGDADSAASALTRLLDEPALAIRLAEAAADRVVNHYSLERTRTRLLQAVECASAPLLRNGGLR